MECGTERSRRKSEFAGAGAAARLATLALVACCACAGPRRAPPPPAEPLVIEQAPAWIRQPLSWEKLQAIETWLAQESAGHDPRFVIEGELQLNEGRLLFTDRDQRADQVPPSTLAVRVQAAVSGFDHVLASEAASPIQRSRAENGLAAAKAILSGTRPGPALAIIPRSEWGARPARTDRMTPLRGTWSRITVHHSAESSSDPNGGSLADSASTLLRIQKYHTRDPSHLWGDIGYHFLIDSSGRIFEGRSLEWQGAHAGGVNGTNNRQNIGICMLGDYAHGSPRPAALKSLELLLEDLRARYRIPASRVYPHREFGTTICPGPALTQWIDAYRRR